MDTRTAEAFSPGGISSFFEICDTKANGQPLQNLEKRGARGGGFVVQKGVHTRVESTVAETSSIRIAINGKLALEAETSKTVAENLLEKKGKSYKIMITHKVEVPIGAGFGSSAGGALGTALALSKALDLKLTYNQLGTIAHVAEIKCKTGLGTVGPIMLGGCILTVEPGGPGVGVIDRIPLSANSVIVAGTFNPMPTKNILLSSPEKRVRVNRCGRETLDAILQEPSPENFMKKCAEFAEKTGFMTSRVKGLIKVAEKAGAIGAAQNMVGEAAHALTTEENAEHVAEAFRRVLSEGRVTVARIDFQGARLLEP